MCVEVGVCAHLWVHLSVLLCLHTNMCSLAGILSFTQLHKNLDVVERLFVGDVVNEHDAHGPAVVGGGDGAESLLAGSVPNLKLDLLAVHLDGPNLEIDPYRRYERRIEGVFGEPGEEIRWNREDDEDEKMGWERDGERKMGGGESRIQSKRKWEAS